MSEFKDKIEKNTNAFEELTDQIVKNDSNVVGIAVALVVGFFTLLLLFLWTRKKSLGRDILFCGPCDGGKTTLISQLVVGKPVETYTSMMENKFSWEVEGKPSVNLVDIPGHERIRNEILGRFSSSARGIVYVVDSNTVSKQVRDVADFLHNILSDKTIFSNRPSIAVYCNKQDGGLAKSSDVIRTLLEKEIEKVRVTSSHQLEGLEGGNSIKQYLGKEGKSFEFKDIPHSITFMEGSAIELDSLQNVRNWLESVA